MLDNLISYPKSLDYDMSEEAIKVSLQTDIVSLETDKVLLNISVIADRRHRLIFVIW